MGYWDVSVGIATDSNKLGRSFKERLFCIYPFFGVANGRFSPVMGWETAVLRFTRIALAAGAIWLVCWSAFNKADQPFLSTHPIGGIQ